MIGEESQKAMTAESGTPAAKSEATTGTTPQEQKGEKAPARVAMKIAASGLRETASAIS
jgi:hypothetical protein